MPPRIRLTATDTIIESDAAADNAAADAFARRHGIVLDDLLAPEIQERLASVWRDARFEPRETERIGTRMLETPPRAGAMLAFLLARPPLPQWLARVTQSRAIATVTGAIARLRAGHGDGLDWHADGGRGRVLGVTVNLGDEDYEGGRFELRRRDSDAILLAHDHKRPGSALVFSVARDLVHRVTPLTAGGPRTVFSGWFVAPPDGPA